MAEDKKWCKKGDHWVSRDMFYEDRTYKNGLRPYCKPCYNEYQTAARKAKREERLLVERGPKVSDQHKWCTRGKHWVEHSGFPRDTRNSDGMKSWCRECCNLFARTTRTPDLYFEILEKQDGRCSLCSKTEEENGRRLAIDHDHRCCPPNKYCEKCVRGLLCLDCNIGLGMFKDNPELLILASEYLQKWNAIVEIGEVN